MDWTNLLDFIIDILSTNDISIHCLIKGKHISWFGTFIYGFSHQHLQNQLQKQIRNLSNTGKNDWFILGDLNEISNPSEKLSTSKGNSTRCNNFDQIMLIIFFQIMLVILIPGIIKERIKLSFLPGLIVLLSTNYG